MFGRCIAVCWNAVFEIAFWSRFWNDIDVYLNTVFGLASFAGRSNWMEVQRWSWSQSANQGAWKQESPVAEARATFRSLLRLSGLGSDFLSSPWLERRELHRRAVSAVSGWSRTRACVRVSRPSLDRRESAEGGGMERKHQRGGRGTTPGTRLPAFARLESCPGNGLLPAARPGSNLHHRPRREKKSRCLIRSPPEFEEGRR